MSEQQANLRLTPQRAAVLKVVRESGDHLTAGEILDSAHTRGWRLSQATVYNSLRFLAAAGLVREVQYGDGASRYDGNVLRHDHLVCTACGAMLDVQVPGVDAGAQATSAAAGFQFMDVRVTISGVCPGCRHTGA